MNRTYLVLIDGAEFCRFASASEAVGNAEWLAADHAHVEVLDVAGTAIVASFDGRPYVHGSAVNCCEVIR